MKITKYDERWLRTYEGHPTLGKSDYPKVPNFLDFVKAGMKEFNVSIAGAKGHPMVNERFINAMGTHDNYINRIEQQASLYCSA